MAGMSGYHTSVLVDEQEYFFDAIGILEAPAFFSHSLNEQAQSPDEVQPDVSENFALSRGDRGKMVVIPIGYSRHSGRDLVAALQQHFERGLTGKQRCELLIAVKDVIASVNNAANSRDPLHQSVSSFLSLQGISPPSIKCKFQALGL